MNDLRVEGVSQAKLHLQALPSDFKAVTVNTDSYRLQQWKRISRNLEKQLKVDASVFGSNADEVTYAEYVTKLLDQEGFDTSDLERSFVIIGNKNGAFSGQIFNQLNWQKLVVDLSNFDNNPNYPIFLDTSTTRIIFSDKAPIGPIKRERLEETFSTAPQPKKIDVESISDLQAHWADQEEQYRLEIDTLKSRELKTREANEELIRECSRTELALDESVAESSKAKLAYEKEISNLKEEVRALQVTPMEMTQSGPIVFEETAEPILKSPVIEDRGVPESEQKGGRISSLFGQMFDPLISSQDNSSDKQVVYKGPLSLSRFGLTPWNPDTTSFLDYSNAFTAAASEGNITHTEAITLLFAALPAKYSYLRSSVTKHPKYDSKDFNTAHSLLVKMIAGGTDRIFQEFQKLQRKPNQSYLEFFERCKNYYRYMMDKPEDLNTDKTAFREIRQKMVNAYPSRFVPEFKRRLEGKTTMTDIFDAILDLVENFPEVELDGSSDGNDLYALRQKNEDWQKKVKCFGCGKKGHIKRNCYKREAKTPKSGRKDQ